MSFLFKDMKMLNDRSLLLSFIIPVYNGEGTITRCIESIFLNLELEPSRDYEIIVIDDCSLDNTRRIVEDLASQKKGIRLLCQDKNHRQGAARNRGIKEAQGERIMFVDADDVLLPPIQHSVETSLQKNVDLVYSFIEIERKASIEVFSLESFPTGVVSGQSFIEHYCKNGVYYYTPSYIFNRSFLLNNRLFFIEDRQCEDRDWLANAVLHANSILVSPFMVYKYCYYPSSASHALSFSTTVDHVASGIRHIKLSQTIQDKCPKLSEDLCRLGTEEIVNNLRFRHLTKFPLSCNMVLYGRRHLHPFRADLKSICQRPDYSWETHFIATKPWFCIPVLFFLTPVSHIIRVIKHR